MPKMKRKNQDNNNDNNRRKRRRVTPYQLLSTNNRYRPNSTVATIPINAQLFPDVLYTCGVVMIPGQLTGSTNTTWTFHGNSAGNKYGPQVNYTGVFNIESPAGLQYLLSSANPLGAAAPYTRMWTLRSDIEVQFINYGTVPVEVALLPSTQSSFSGSASSTLAEQSGAISHIFPPITSTTQTLKATYDWAAVLGVSKQVYESEIDLAQGAGGLPANLAFWHIQWVSTDNATNFTGSVKIVVRHHLKFGGLQQFTSGDPS